MENYNNICNKYFTTELNNKYNISFYSDNDEQHYLILKLNNKIIWATYKILCSYDVKYNILKKGNEMIMINKSIIDDNIILNNIKNIEHLENIIMKYISDNKFNGYVIKRKGDITFYFLINKIIKLI